MRILFALLLLAALTACGDTSATATVTASATDTIPTTNELAPPPPACVYLTEATVLSYFDNDVKLPLPAHRAPGNFSSCQYDLEAATWSAALVLEMPQPGRQQSIIDEVAGATGNERATFPNGAGKFTNAGRVLSVAGEKHFRLKFSALPKGDAAAPFDEAARRKLLMRMAGGVLGI